MNTTLSRLLGALNDILEHGPETPEFGICQNVDVIVPKSGYLTKYYSSWEHFTGSYYYPVPAPDEYGIQRPDYPELFEVIYTDEEISKWSGQYGELRLDLLRHLIECVEQELL